MLERSAFEKTFNDYGEVQLILQKSGGNRVRCRYLNTDSREWAPDKEE
jgi:hypothetical protein